MFLLGEAGGGRGSAHGKACMRPQVACTAHVLLSVYLKREMEESKWIYSIGDVIALLCVLKIRNDQSHINDIYS